MTLPEPANALSAEPDLIGAFGAWLAERGTTSESYLKAARLFFARWPDPAAWAAQPLNARLRLNPNLRVVVSWLILYHDLHPGYDWLASTTPYTCWQELPATRHWPDVERFLATAVNLGYAQRTRTKAACRVLMRLLLQTGGPMSALTEADLAELAETARTHMDWRAFSACCRTARLIMGAAPALRT